VELGRKQADFARQGLNVASITYDSPEALKNFSDRKSISVPMLSDPDSKIIRDFGILNETVPKGTPFYGVPYPGTFVLDATGVVQKKFFEDNYRERYTAGTVLLQTSPEAARAGWQEAKTNHLSVRWKASDDTLHGGDHTTLLLEVTLNKKMHVYAPGVQGSYIPVKWDLKPSDLYKAEETKWPQAKILDLKAIGEKAPVYEGRLEIRRDVTFSQQKQLQAASEGKPLEVEAAFRYQACDDKVCYPPVNVPLKWTFQFEPHDSTRVPAELRRK
jgi:alkyl hydroperoxide reductase subunit AhpC